MRGMSFLDYRQFLRDTSRKADCILMCKSSKGILIDANGKWEVKYCSKNHQHKSQYTLVGWFDTEEEAVRAYNKTALQHGDERAIVRSFFKKKTGYPRVASPTRDDSGTTIENTERTLTLAHPASNNSHSSKEEVTSASHPRASCWERATDASKRDASGSMEACARDDKNDDTEMHDASVNVSVLPQQTDGSSLSDPDELEDAHLQMQEECQGRSQFTDAGIKLFNLFPGGTPLDYSLEVPTFDFFPAEPLSTDNQDVSGLTHLKREGPFEIDLTL
ncbi:protein MpAP2L7 [Marchantia polymorpha subsp. ruderalis]|uniref:AP2/ERF domain-containing protein n=2 Tax=Marchantia polymorpha TaxID=3197 RepID=A0AAF6BSU1_MARPO|nr:hypothetical protein MARPO_1480s0001 [Marchantia polymorpha]BBN15075.1 hypothetical protein Mp_6g16770 [Marchantia polymorpha subsp. ruderalis]|eukprot:PTQ26472.1 hypothetical protein MARPO_1480s0001 [Marchantia polymorpha]